MLGQDLGRIIMANCLIVLHLVRSKIFHTHESQSPNFMNQGSLLSPQKVVAPVRDGVMNVGAQSLDWRLRIATSGMGSEFLGTIQHFRLSQKTVTDVILYLRRGSECEGSK
jgi:hypothetical protein